MAQLSDTKDVSQALGRIEAEGSCFRILNTGENDPKSSKYQEQTWTSLSLHSTKA